MNITIRSISEEHIHCPRCGSKNIVGKNIENIHCGNCGTYFIVEYVEKLKMEEPVSKEQNEYTQMSLFDE